MISKYYRYGSNPLDMDDGTYTDIYHISQTIQTINIY